MFTGNFAPQGWATCDGQLLPINQNTALFAILGTTYGGNGIQTFALPDLRGRAPIHPGQGPGLSPYNLGQLGGSENTTLLVNNLPQHTHLVNCKSAGGNQAAPGGGLPAVESTGTSLDYSSNPPDGTMSPQMIAPAGQNQPFPTVQPFACVNFIIALQGIFPSRG
jgi:microcystin-dependent protein